MLMNSDSKPAGDAPFTEEQSRYLEGFASGAQIAMAAQGLGGLGAALGRLSGGAAATGGGATAQAGTTPLTIEGAAMPAIHREAQNRTITAGGKLCAEEKAKREKDPLAMLPEIEARAARGEFPKGTDVFLTKYHGMFYVAPAQDSFMCRLRFPGGIVTTDQMAGVADLADRYGGGYSHVTTRANLQIREIKATDPVRVIEGLTDLGIVNRGAGADNIRNVTGSPTAGIDPDELIDTRAIARRMHHHILRRPEMYGLPRKFNIAYDGGGRISALAETNDIGFVAVRLSEQNSTAELPAGVYYRMGLGGITGHRDFTADTGVMLTEEQTIVAAEAVVRVFIRRGDRTDRRKARLKYVLDSIGLAAFMKEVEQENGKPFARINLKKCERPDAPDPLGHIGIHRQRQGGLNYIGVALSVGRLTTDQMRGLAAIARRFGSGTIRLTVWQNLILSDIADADLEPARRAIKSLGLSDSATNIRAGLIACTGNSGCKFAASDTKGHALAIAEHLDSILTLDTPLNIHLTGCHHSCAQHYIGDIGLLGAKVSIGDDMVEGYHVYVGGASGSDPRIGRELMRDVTAADLPHVIERMLIGYREHRGGTGQTFREFCEGRSIEQLTAIFGAAERPVAV